MNSIFVQIQNCHHWDEQISLLEQLGISESSARLLNDSKNAGVIKNLLTTQRTKVIISTVQFLMEIFDGYGPLLHSFALNIMGSECLFKLLNSPSKILSSAANQLIKSIIVNSPHPKYYVSLAPEMSSKSSAVREFVLSYMLVLTEFVEFPAKLYSNLQKMKQDPNANVRSKAKSLLEVLKKGKKEKSKARKICQNKQNMNTSEHEKKQKSMISKNGNSKLQHNKSVAEISHSEIIMNSFNQDLYEVPDSIGIEFLVKKIRSDDAWNIKAIAIEEFLHFVSNFQIPESHFKMCFEVLVHLLTERRSHVNEVVPEILMNLMGKELQIVSSFMGTMAYEIMEKSVKSEKTAHQIIPSIIGFDPVKYILQACQVSIDLKSIKEKALMLDILVEAICENHQLPAAKVSPIVKILCKLLDKHHSQKQIYLPCMAILSHFKTVHPDELLSCLLCQGNEVLSRIISIAEEIDPSLGEKILNYIRGLKSLPEKHYKNESEIGFHPEIAHEVPQLFDEFQRVKRQEEGCVEGLAQVIFDNLETLEIPHFVAILRLPQQILSEPNLLQMELLLQELCKTSCPAYLEALFLSCKSQGSQTKIYDEYILSNLRKIRFFLQNTSEVMYKSHCEKLLNLYRYSKNPKIRMTCIKTLCLFPHNLIDECSSQKQKQLIRAQSKAQDPKS